MTDSRSRDLVRVALALSHRPAASPQRNDLPAVAWENCLEAAALLAEVERRCWRAAEAECRQRLRRQLEELRWQLDAARDELDRSSAARRATAREIYDDLRALESEFPGVRIDLKERELAVTTEPVTLEGVPLGPFEVVLDWTSAAAWDYRVVALDANPPTGQDDVTHPHVRDDQLCEGEGRSAIRQALAAGRLFDFFTIVAQTLNTYNAASAFVALRLWHGVPCRMCGDSSDEDYSSNCERCGCDLCDECGAACSACGNWCCLDCTAGCPACDSTVCGACLARCATCQQSFCQECIHDDNCPGCRAEASDEESADDEPELGDAAPVHAHAAAVADGVG